MDRTWGHEGTLAAPAADEPLSRQVLHRLPGGHPAHRELLGQLELRGDRVTGGELLYPLP